MGGVQSHVKSSEVKKCSRSGWLLKTSLQSLWMDMIIIASYNLNLHCPMVSSELSKLQAYISILLCD